MTDLQNSTTPPLAYSECYVQPFFSFYNADNMAIMKTFKDKEFDLAIVDPPYGIDLGKKKTIGKRGKTYSITNYKQSEWDSNIPNIEYFNELKRISKNQIIWGGNYFIDYLNNTRCVLFWSKQYIPEGFSMADCEMAWTSFDASAKMVRVPIEHNCVSNNPQKALKYAKIHQAQKPIGLYEFILKYFANENDKIIDTHLGSGSIAIAIDKANTLDKKNLTFVGIELDPDYFRAAVERFKNHKRQCVLF